MIDQGSIVEVAVSDVVHSLLLIVQIERVGSCYEDVQDNSQGPYIA